MPLLIDGERALVIGRGWVGKKVRDELTSRSVPTDLVSHTDCFSYLSRYSWVINCAGVTGKPNVDACESMVDETFKGNAVFPCLLYQECQKYNVRLVHFSSGCIYEGEIIDTNAPPNFFGSVYSISKGISDSYLRNKSIVIRIRMPFIAGDCERNYLTKIRRYAEIGKLYNSGKNSLTDLDEAVRITADLIVQNAPNGAYNLVNKGYVTMKELAKIMNINAEYHTDDSFKKVTKAQRSTCTIPAYYKMSPLLPALERALNFK